MHAFFTFLSAATASTISLVTMITSSTSTSSPSLIPLPNNPAEVLPNPLPLGFACGLIFPLYRRTSRPHSLSANAVSSTRRFVALAMSTRVHLTTTCEVALPSGFARVSIERIFVLRSPSRKGMFSNSPAEKARDSERRTGHHFYWG